MRLDELEKRISHLLIINKNILRAFEPNEHRLNENVKSWLRNGALISLKKGLYILRERYEKEPDKAGYLAYLAGKMVEPSYLSLEYVLDAHRIMSEPASVITSVTPKSTREITNELGTFRYASVREALFCGYDVKSFSGATFYEASKEKALFDFLYLYFFKNRNVSSETIENLRLNWENFSGSEFKKFSEFVKLSENKRMKRVADIIRTLHYV